MLARKVPPTCMGRLLRVLTLDCGGPPIAGAPLDGQRTLWNLADAVGSSDSCLQRQMIWLAYVGVFAGAVLAQTVMWQDKNHHKRPTPGDT
jgi:hypothetical protein